jgi:drug/metabolite transporter (DMT)-like permease
MTRSLRTGVVLAFLCLLILGAMPILSNARPAEFDGLTFAVWLTFWQLLAALPLFLLEAAARRGGTAPSAARHPQRLRIGLIALATGAMFGLSTYMYVVAAEKAGAVSMIIALQAYPLFAILWETLFLGNRKTLAELGCTAVILVALVYLTTEGTLRISGISWWSAYALGIPLLWSVAHVLLRQILVTMPVTPNQVTVSRLEISGAFLLFLQLVIGESGALAAALGDMAFQKAAIVMGVAYYLELILWFYAMRHVDVSLGSSLTVPAPAVTMLISVIILGEEVQLYQILAMCVIALAIYGLLLAGKRRPPVEQAGEA